MSPPVWAGDCLFAVIWWWFRPPNIGFRSRRISDEFQEQPPLSRLTRKQPHPVKNPLNLSVLSCVHSMKFIKKACRPCFLPKRLQQDHFCSLLTRTSLINVTQPHSNRWAANQSNCSCSEGSWYVFCRPCFCWCSLYGRRDGKVQNVSY